MKSFVASITRLALLSGFIIAQGPAQITGWGDTWTSPGNGGSISAAQALPSDLYPAFLKAVTQDNSQTFQSTRTGFAAQSQGLAIQLNTDGLQVSPQQGSAWNWHVQLNAFGRGNQPEAVGSAQAAQDEGRVEYRYSGLTEWYRLTGIALEQGFTIEQSPRGNGRLVLQMSLNTSLSGTLSADARNLVFAAGGDGQALHYGNLRVFDANGGELAAKFVYSAKKIIIQIDDEAAKYPITVDPLFFAENKRLALDAVGWDYFGDSVAISGDTAVVGAYGKDTGGGANYGAAYVFVRAGVWPPVWTQAAKLTASDGAPGDGLGYSVAISGDTIVAGAYADDVGANMNQGSAYVFIKPVAGWADMTQTAKLTASDGADNSHFGTSVSISGDTVVAGANTHNASRGSAYVFVKPGAGWTGNLHEDARLTASDAAAGDYLGFGVAISGDAIVAGAPFDDVGANIAQGSAYVFVKPGAGWATGTETAKLTASDGAAIDVLGWSVAISGDTILIGAPGVNALQGSAYVFVKPAGPWATTAAYAAKLIASDGVPADQFGVSVGISGAVVVVGAQTDNAAQGSAYVFVEPALGWASIPPLNQTNKLIASDGVLNDYFGYSAAISGDTALVGALRDDVGIAPDVMTDEGSAYFYFPFRYPEDLAVTAVSSSATPAPGQSITLTTGVTALTLPPAAAVLLSAPLPAGLTFIKSVQSAGVYDPSTGAWTVGTLPSGVTATLDIQATVNTTAAGSHLTFTSSLVGSDSNNLNNAASVSLNVLPYPPAAFNKSVPLNGAVKRSSSPTLKWTASAGATAYEYCIDTSNNSTCNTAWVSAGTATTKVVSGLGHGVRYYWQVRATNAGGTTYANGGVWWSFKTLPLPGVFNKSAPAKGAVNQPRNPTLRWGASSNRISYQYCIDTSNNNTCNTAWLSAGTATIKVLSGLAHGVRYYWQVRAVNAAGYRYANAGAWWYFTVH